jgi:hypothetical protein
VKAGVTNVNVDDFFNDALREEDIDDDVLVDGWYYETQLLIGHKDHHIEL